VTVGVNQRFLGPPHVVIEGESPSTISGHDSNRIHP
jgi:hypothetical protein